MAQDPSAQRWAELMKAGDRAMASAQLERAAELFAGAAARAREAGAAEALGTSLHRLCVVRDRQGQAEEAAWFAQQALQVDEEAHGPVHPAVARDLHGLGLARLAAGQPQQAVAALQRSASISRRLNSHRELLLTLLALGRAEGREGAATLEEVCALAARVPGGLPYALRAENALAAIALSKGKPQEAHARWTAVTRTGAGPERDLRWQAELAEAWLGLATVAESARQDRMDAIWMLSLALRALGPRPHPLGARALAALDRLGAAPQLLPDAPVPPQTFFVVAWTPEAEAGDIAHPFGGRHRFPASAAPEGLAVGDRVEVRVEHGALVALEPVSSG